MYLRVVLIQISSSILFLVCKTMNTKTISFATFYRVLFTSVFYPTSKPSFTYDSVVHKPGQDVLPESKTSRVYI